MVDVIKVTLDVDFDHREFAFFNQLIHFAQGSFGTAAGAKAVAAVMELLFKDRFNYLFECGFHNSIADRWDSQWPFGSASGFVDPFAAGGTGLVAFLPEFLLQAFQLLIQITFESADAYVIDSGGSVIAFHRFEGSTQVTHFPYFVHQAEPFASFDPFFKGFQHAVCPDTGLRPVPSGTEFSSLFSPFGHCRWCFFPVAVHCTSIFLPPFTPRELPRFIATMLALTSLQGTGFAGISQVIS